MEKEEGRREGREGERRGEKSTEIKEAGVSVLRFRNHVSFRTQWLLIHHHPWDSSRDSLCKGLCKFQPRG